MKIAILGASGQLGFDLVQLLNNAALGHQALPFAGRKELDITDAAAFTSMLERQRPDAVLNTAAFHNVDLCETEVEAAYRTNVIAVREMAKACEARGVRFVQIGTDYVVEGAPDGAVGKARPVPESAPVQPKSIYALTRYGGDCMTLAHAPTMGYVVRTCGLFGLAGCKLKGGLNFVDTMLKAAKEGKPLKVVNDQTVAPTSTQDLAAQLLVVLEGAVAGRVPPGLYHAVSHGQCTWYEFAKAALELSGIPHTITPVAGDQWPTPAKRPTYSVLDNAKLRALDLDRMSDWHTALARYVKTKYGKG